MPIATLTLELAIEHAQSLKDRRQVVRSLKDKLRHGFNISIAEMDDALLWNRATLGVVAISSSAGVPERPIARGGSGGSTAGRRVGM